MIKRTILPLLALLLPASFTASAQWVRAALPDTVAVTTLAASDSVVLAGVPEQGVYVSTDSGRTFIRRNLSSYSNATGVMAIKSDTIYVTTGKACPGGSYLLRSTDFGKNWTDLFTIPDIYISSMHFSGKRIILGSVNHGIFISRDDGLTFDTINDGLPRYVDDTTLYTAVYSILALDNQIMAGTGDGGIFIADTVNFAWQEVNEGLPMMSVQSYYPVNEIFNDNSNLIAAMPGRGIALSGLEPIHWSEETTGMTSPYPSGFCRLGADGVAVYAENSIFRTLDHGSSWEQVNTDEIGAAIRSIASNGLYLFAGTADAGLWMIPEEDIMVGAEGLLNRESGWVLFPNPTDGVVWIRMRDAGYGMRDVVVTDMAGRVVLCQQTEESVDLSSLEPGAYFIRVKGSGARIVLKK